MKMRFLDSEYNVPWLGAAFRFEAENTLIPENLRHHIRYVDMFVLLDQL